jgi:gluconolactonase
MMGGPDGMKVDKNGNIFSTGPGGIVIISPQGKHLGTIRFPEIPANLGWGDADGKTLYVTARTGLYRVRTNVEGSRP